MSVNEELNLVKEKDLDSAESKVNLLKELMISRGMLSRYLLKRK
jgi:hypothetical protein